MTPHPPRGLSVASRAALALVFLDGGRHVWAAPSGPADGAGPLLARVRDRVPALRTCTDKQLVQANAGVHVLAGLALLLGVTPRFAAGVLAASLVPTTLAVYAYWELPDGAERGHAKAEFLKNVAVAGGLVGVLAAPSRS